VILLEHAFYKVNLAAVPCTTAEKKHPPKLTWPLYSIHIPCRPLCRDTWIYIHVMCVDPCGWGQVNWVDLLHRSTHQNPLIIQYPSLCMQATEPQTFESDMKAYVDKVREKLENIKPPDNTHQRKPSHI
jgi:hypothetical protein